MLVAMLVTAAATPPLRAADISELTIHEKVGQLVMFSVSGYSLTDHERHVIRRAHLGGVILFAHNYKDRTQLGNLTAQIQRNARRGNSLRMGALTSVDQEGGVVKRFPDMPPRYSAPEMGRIGKTSVAFDQGVATGRALRRAGVNVNLAPVADLDLPPEHVMRSRAFGSRPYPAGKLVRAFSRGLQSRRVAATAKHFPGLGGATINTDYGRAYVYRSRHQLRNVDEVPFRRAIGGNIRLVMLSHALYVNDGGRVPASLHPYYAKKRLRRALGFTGVAISDDLNRVAWRFGGDVTKACVKTVKAGVDVALITGRVDAARACAAAIRRAVRSGDIPKRRLDQAVGRVLELKQWLGLYQP